MWGGAQLLKAYPEPFLRLRAFKAHSRHTSMADLACPGSQNSTPEKILPPARHLRGTSSYVRLKRIHGFATRLDDVVTVGAAGQGLGYGAEFCWLRVKYLETISSSRPSNNREISRKAVLLFLSRFKKSGIEYVILAGSSLLTLSGAQSRYGSGLVSS